jgi:RHS repeat-associated protein
MHGMLQPVIPTHMGGIPRSYSAYGAYAGARNIAFGGQMVDRLTGCYHLGNGRRTYNPVLMRFHSADSLSPFSDGGLNAYAYCNGDPINRVDPSGAYPVTSARNRVDVISPAISGISMFSSSVTLGGAVARTARNVVADLQSQHSGAEYTAPSLRSRIGNTSLFYTGVMGVAGTAMSGVEQGWIGNVLTSHGRRLGLGNAIGNISGGLFSNAEAAQAVWRGVGQPGVSGVRVAWETVYEVTGVRMVFEGASYVWGRSMALGARIASAGRAAADAWRRWGTEPSAPPPSPNRDIRRP